MRAELEVDTLIFAGQTEKDDLKGTEPREQTYASCFKVWF